MKELNGIDMGDEVRDEVTGFGGVVTGYARYLTGCAQVLVQPKVKEGGDWQEGRWFDVDRLTLAKSAAHVHVVKTAVGGPPGSAPVK